MIATNPALLFEILVLDSFIEGVALLQLLSDEDWDGAGPGDGHY